MANRWMVGNESLLNLLDSAVTRVKLKANLDALDLLERQGVIITEDWHRESLLARAAVRATVSQMKPDGTMCERCRRFKATYTHYFDKIGFSCGRCVKYVGSQYKVYPQPAEVEANRIEQVRLRREIGEMLK